MRNFIKILAIWTTSIAISLSVLATFLYLALTAVDLIYYKLHPLSVGQDDLGAGLVGILSFFAALFVSVPLCIWLAFFIKNTIYKYFKEEK